MQKTFYVQILQKKKATLIILTLKTKEDVTIHSTSIFDLKNLILYCFEIPRKRPNERKRVRIGAIYFRSNNKKFLIFYFGTYGD